MIYYYGSVPCIAGQDFPHPYDVFWSGESIDGVFFGHRPGNGFFLFVSHLSEWYFFYSWNRWSGPDLFLPPWFLVPYSSCRTRLSVRLVSVKIEVGGSFRVYPKSRAFFFLSFLIPVLDLGGYAGNYGLIE